MPIQNSISKVWIEALEEEIMEERPPIVLSVIDEKTSSLYQSLKKYLMS